MGNTIGRALCAGDVTRNWPPSHANKKHWCFEYGSDSGSSKHYCDDPQVGDPQYDTNFDYAVFRCREARCGTCLDLNPNLYPARELWRGNQWLKVDPQSREIHVTWKSLLESASGSCEICSVLKEGVNLVGGSISFGPDSVFCVELLEAFTVRLTHETPMEGAMDQKERLIVEFHSCVDDGALSTWNAFGAAAILTSNVGVTNCVSFINSSIEKCHQHSKCAQNHAPPTSKLPTRLIDVGTEGDDVRLETSPKAGERYITLSHVWGTLPLTVTTTSNIRQHSEEIPWVSLTRTFQDAISITRGLGIRYIWIDSLCIIQDSSSDWEAEAKVMANVYANSYLTLAATSAAESSEGLFRPRYNLNEEDGREYVREYEIKLGDRLPRKSISARRVTKYSHIFLLSLEYKGGHKELAPLLFRAWALQERFLSPRTLHFCFDELVWECKAGIDCECGFGSSPSGRALSAGPVGRNIFKELFDSSQLPDSLGNDKAHSTDYQKKLFPGWYSLVEYYMALSITYPSDRLPALRGMTKSIEDKLGWTYLEGIWVEDLVPGLLWDANWPRSFRRTKAAPTWSWASMEPIDTSAWDQRFASTPEVYNVLNFGYSACMVHEQFRLIAYSSYSSNEDVSYQNIVPKNQTYIVLEAAFVQATIVAELLTPKATQNPNGEGPNSTSCDNLDEVNELEADSESKINEESKALRLLVGSNKDLIPVSWDIRNNSKKNEYSEIAEDDEVAAILLVQGDGRERSSAGLVLKKVVGGLDLYKRVGAFSFQQKDLKYFRDGSRRVIII